MTVTLRGFLADFSLGSNHPAATRIPQLGAYEWWRAGDRQTLVETNKVSIIKGRIDVTKQGASGTSGERPAYSEAGVSGKPALIFDGANDHLSFPLTGGSFFASDFSLVLIFKPAALPASNGYILSTYAGSNTGTLVYMTSAGMLRFQHGDAYMAGAITVGAPTVAILSLEGGFLRGRINGVDMISSLGNIAQKSGLQHGTASLIMGAINNIGPTFLAGAFAISDFIPFTRGIGSDLKTCHEIEDFADRCYGAELAS